MFYFLGVTPFEVHVTKKVSREMKKIRPIVFMGNNWQIVARYTKKYTGHYSPKFYSIRDIPTYRGYHANSPPPGTFFSDKKRGGISVI